MSPGEIGFSPNGPELIVTTKGSMSSIDVFGVAPGGQLSAAPVVTPDTGNVPFSFVFSPSGQLVVAEADVSAVHTFTLGAGGTLTSLASLADAQATRAGWDNRLSVSAWPFGAGRYGLTGTPVPGTRRGEVGPCGYRGLAGTSVSVLHPRSGY